MSKSPERERENQLTISRVQSCRLLFQSYGANQKTRAERTNFYSEFVVLKKKARIFFVRMGNYLLRFFPIRPLVLDVPARVGLFRERLFQKIYKLTKDMHFNKYFISKVI